MNTLGRETVLSPTREKILRVVENNSDISIRQIAEKTGIPNSTVFHNVRAMEDQGLLETRKGGKEKRVHLKTKDLAVKAKRPLLKLIYKYSLDELEVKILLEAKEGETPEEVAKRLGELLMPVEARMMRSIPFKFRVAIFEEARKIFEKEKELVAI